MNVYRLRGAERMGSVGNMRMAVDEAGSRGSAVQIDAPGRGAGCSWIDSGAHWLHPDFLAVGISLKNRACWKSIAFIICTGSLQCAWSAALSDQAIRTMAHDIFKQLIEINTTDSIGSTTVAAQAMAKRLLDAGFPAADVTVLGPNDRKGNMVARYRGKPGSKLRPDVMEALRSAAGKPWPGAPVIPIMEAGASDSIYTMTAGIPSYGICGVAIDHDDVRAHGKDERVRVASYYTGVEFYYEFLKKLTTRKT